MFKKLFVDSTGVIFHYSVQLIKYVFQCVVVIHCSGKSVEIKYIIVNVCVNQNRFLWHGVGSGNFIR